MKNKKPEAFYFVLRSPCTLCFAKIGGGSAKKMKIKGFSFCFALALHYLCTHIKKCYPFVPTGEEKQKHIGKWNHSSMNAAWQW